MNDNHNQSKTSILIVFVFFILCAALFTVISSRLLNQTLTQIIPFDTDEADHANAGLELFRAFQSRAINKIEQAFLRQAFYPPIHSLFLTLSYFLLGVSTASSRAPSTLLFICLGVSLSLLSYRASQIVYSSTRASLIAAAGILLFLSNSKITLVNSSLCMLELCGMFFVSLLLFQLLGESNEDPPSRFLTALATFLVMFTKYSFGIIALPGVMLGLSTTERGLSFSRNGILGAIKILMIFISLFSAWFYFSDRVAIINFFIGHPQNAPLLSNENLFFDFRSWIHEYSSSTVLAVGIAALAVIGAKTSWHLRTTRVSAGIAISGIFILLLSTTNEARHFMVAAPPIWYLGSLGLAAMSKGSDQLDLRYGMTLALTILLAYFNGAYNLIPQIPLLVTREMEGEPSFARLEDFIIENTPCGNAVLIIGATDQFGIEALRWRTAMSCNRAYTTVDVDAFPYRDDKNITNKKRMRNVAYPYKDSSFPKTPIDQVLAMKHYQSLVLIREIGEHGEIPTLIKYLKEDLSTHPTTVKSEGGKEVTVISLM